jgi:hypothetical protein
MLKIIVSLRKLESKDSDGWPIFFQLAVVWEGKAFHYLNDYADFTEVTQLLILVEGKKIFSRAKFKTLKIPENIQSGIIAFLKTYQGKQDIAYDCRSFVNSVFGVTQHPTKYLLGFWKTEPLDWWPRAGDVVFLVAKHERDFRHAAVCIGPDLYVSVYGAGGDLEFASLEDMKKSFQAEQVLFAVPREDPIY